MNQVNIEDFLNKHLVKVFYAVIVYFLMGLSTDFKEMKITLQQLLINQATVESRLMQLEARAVRNSERLDKADAASIDFYKTYKLTPKD